MARLTRFVARYVLVASIQRRVPLTAGESRLVCSYSSSALRFALHCDLLSLAIIRVQPSVQGVRSSKRDHDTRLGPP